jgi:outer membrane protein assembly factor BamB
MRRTIHGAALTALIALSVALAEPAASPALEGVTGTPGEWQQFGYDPAHRGVNPLETTIQPGNVATLHRLYRAPLPGLVNGAPVFLAGVQTRVGLLDLLFMTTVNGKILAVDAATGRILWSHQPADRPGITASAPAIDPGRQLVYSYGLEGRVHRYRTGDGREVIGGGWPEVATIKPRFEKCSPALAIATAASGRSYLYVTNGGALDLDRGDYQGHITAIDLGSGAQRVWNADCSDQPVHFAVRPRKPNCPAVQSAVWERGGVVYDSDLDRIFFATGNGAFDVPQGRHDWGDSVLELQPDGTGNGALPMDSYTPASFQQLADQDLDLGSTAPALLPPLAASRYPHLGLQSGKDGLIRLLDLDDLSGQGRPGQVGGELLTIPVPQGGEVLTAPAVWVDPASGTAWVFLANDAGISGLQLTADAGGTPSLLPVWTRLEGGTSPVVANGIVFYVGPAGLQALSPENGAVLWSDPLPGKAGIHWQSPIVIDGRIYVADQGRSLWAYAPAAPPTGAATRGPGSGPYRVRAVELGLLALLVLALEMALEIQAACRRAPG